MVETLILTLRVFVISRLRCLCLCLCLCLESLCELGDLYRWACRCIFPRSARAVRFVGRVRRGGVKLTAAEVAFSWVALPVTLKATPLGAVSLNSRVVAARW